MTKNNHPVFALDGDNQWHFGESDAKVLNISVSCFFEFAITPEQVTIVTTLLNNGINVSGHYKTWNEFLIQNNIN